MAVGQKPHLFDCTRCQWGRHCDEKMEWPGSVGPAPFNKWGVKGIDEEFNICLLPMISRKSREMLSLYGHYKNGYLPYPGGMWNQPAFYIKAMQIIDAAMQVKD